MPKIYITWELGPTTTCFRKTDAPPESLPGEVDVRRTLQQLRCIEQWEADRGLRIQTHSHLLGDAKILTYTLRALGVWILGNIQFLGCLMVSHSFPPCCWQKKRLRSHWFWYGILAYHGKVLQIMFASSCCYTCFISFTFKIRESFFFTQTCLNLMRFLWPFLSSEPFLLSHYCGAGWVVWPPKSSLPLGGLRYLLSNIDLNRDLPSKATHIHFL